MDGGCTVGECSGVSEGHRYVLDLEFFKAVDPSATVCPMRSMHHSMPVIRRQL